MKTKKVTKGKKPLKTAPEATQEFDDELLKELRDGYRFCCTYCGHSSKSGYAVQEHVKKNCSQLPASAYITAARKNLEKRQLRKKPTFHVAKLPKATLERKGVHARGFEMFMKGVKFPRNVSMAPVDNLCVRVGVTKVHKEGTIYYDSEKKPRKNIIEKYRNELKKQIKNGTVSTVLVPILFEPAKTAKNLANMKNMYHAALVIVKVERRNGKSRATAQYLDSYNEKLIFQNALAKPSFRLKLKSILGVNSLSNIPPADIFLNEVRSGCMAVVAHWCIMYAQMEVVMHPSCAGLVKGLKARLHGMTQKIAEW